MAAEQAHDLLEGLGDRWRHVRAVGALAESLRDRPGGLSAPVVAAAWLHDVGYSTGLVDTGMHAIDGARGLIRLGAPTEVVALVAHHTGALFEAEERGLLGELEDLPVPNPTWLDALTLIDLVVGPAGALTTPQIRIEEILARYAPRDPVHRAVTRSKAPLLASAERARAQLGLPDEWPLDVAEGVLQS